MANPTYEMYEPIAGGFRARLAAALTPNASGSIGPIGVSLNTSGRVVKGSAGNSGLVGLLVKNVARGPVSASLMGTNQLHGGTPNPNAPIGVRAGDAVDIMTNGMISNLDPAVFTAGTKFYVTPAGEVVADDAAGNIQIGHTVAAGTLIVRFVPGVPATV